MNHNAYARGLRVKTTIQASLRTGLHMVLSPTYVASPNMEAKSQFVSLK